ncbi:hypothetical protein VNO78_14828 [Psophocarpus tetragonolobus]|uniref:Uncharacterized protein n=1 Tax=Psophocarpus tetragonolobus TaxID=3891 RepID=A0AAN9SDI6_PSOTE
MESEMGGQYKFSLLEPRTTGGSSFHTTHIAHLPLYTNKERSISKDSMRASKKKVSCKRLGGYLKEQKGRLYIIRRCVVMLLCWHD